MLRERDFQLTWIPQKEQFKLRLENTERHWEMETALRRNEIAAAFNQSFLGVLGQLVEAMRDGRL